MARFFTFLLRRFLFFVSALLLMVALDCHAQSYSLSGSAGTFTPVASGTAVDAVESDDSMSSTIPIGFSFNYYGNTYTQLKACSNGFLTFDLTTIADAGNVINNTYTLKSIAPLWDDLDGTGGTAVYTTTGAAGSRVFTFEWMNWKWNYNASAAGISFQVKLYETTNTIEFVYRQEAGTVVNGSASIGLTGNSFYEFYSVASISASPTLSVTGNNSLNSKPVSGQIYAFTPTTFAAPATQATNVTITSSGSSTMGLGWTNGSGNYRTVFMMKTSLTSGMPAVVDGDYYRASATFLTGDYISDWYCVYNGTGNSVTIAGLESGETYRVAVIEYNGLGGAQKYLPSAGTNNPINTTTTLAAPTAPVSTLAAVGVNSTAINLELTKGNGTRRAIFVNGNTLPAPLAVVDNTTYTANSVYGLGTQVGSSGWYCVYNGSSAAYLTITGLSGNTSYTIQVVDYNGPAGSERYNVAIVQNNPISVTTFKNVPLPAYTFAASTTTFTPITGSEINTIEDDDILSSPIPLNFDFVFGGIAFNTLRASSNGYLSFNPYVLNNNSSFSIDDLSGSIARPVIAPLWDDLQGAGGQASYVTTGTAPNRVFTIEYLNWKWSYSAAAAGISFQVKLYETSNKIEFIYRSEAGALSLPSASIGLAFANSGVGNFISLNNTTASPTSSTTTVTSSLASKPASGQVYSFTPVKASQTITFGTLSNKTVGDASFTLAGSASSGLAISYSSSNTAVATVSGNTVTLVGAGNVTITASQPGDGNYNAATDVPQSFTVNKGSQTITFAQPNAKTYNAEPFTLGATTSSGLAITYTSSNPLVATVSGTTVTIVGVGTTDITASQSGNANYTAATNVVRTLTVNKASQTITFAVLEAKKTGDPVFSLDATASSGLSISYQSSNTSVATVSGSMVTIVGSGTTTITASQSGNANYNAATNVVQSLVVKMNQVISFSQISVKTFGDAAFTLSATTTSGLPVTFSSASEKVTISGNQVTIVKPGLVTIKAVQSGNDTFSEATAEQTFCVNPPKPSFTVSGLDTETPLLTSGSTSGNQWFKDGVVIDGAVNPTLSASTIGSYSVTISVDNCQSAPSDGQTFVITAVEETDLSVAVYPNPADDKLIVDVTSIQSEGPVSLAIYDLLGRVVYRTLGEGKINVTTASFPSGQYVLKIQRTNGTITKRISKK